MRTSVVIPWRTDHGPRQRALDWVLPRWERTEFEIVLGEDDEAGPFNLSRAVNRALAKSSGDYVVKVDADMVPDPARVRNLDRDAGWSFLFARTRILGEHATDDVLDRGADPAVVTPDLDLPFCCGIFAAHRDVWGGGMDEDFLGWGGEDIAQLHRFAALGGPGAPGAGTGICLWHPVADRARVQANWDLLAERYRQS